MKLNEDLARFQLPCMFANLIRYSEKIAKKSLESMKSQILQAIKNSLKA